ncbi:MAG: phosphoribosylglycinamide formyltransferase [Gammaproteobacteria bacterium]|nr:phosphoribosylglycinamide formyltransferase [Gammaproteobacteria bacterium]MBT8133976.1 phosphoribosylglycinamide formyltransferase [Gammaproteobacteria bacterium]NNJ50574.1 phosphoribosylglycinamide formyltransferase [Gammaproteobacteria bacterium]
MAKASLVVLISGSGSNLQAIIDAIENKELDAEIKAVISNTATALGLERAARANIETHVVDHKQYSDRESFDRAMMHIIEPLEPDLVVLAGFMRILSDTFIDRYQHRLINIHPSLLPKYKGLNTHQQALDNKDAIHGASVHFVSHELDSGPVVIQAEIPVLDTDTSASLGARVLNEEHVIYPMVIGMHTAGRLTFKGDQLNLDEKPLTEPLIWKNQHLSR